MSQSKAILLNRDENSPRGKLIEHKFVDGGDGDVIVFKSDASEQLVQGVGKVAYFWHDLKAILLANGWAVIEQPSFCLN